jgi:hypothetical protein
MEVASRSRYNEDEVERHHGLVTTDLNRYLAKKYPRLRDAEIVEKYMIRAKLPTWWTPSPLSAITCWTV